MRRQTGNEKRASVIYMRAAAMFAIQSGIYEEEGKMQVAGNASALAGTCLVAAGSTFSSEAEIQFQKAKALWSKSK
ncbi:MAG: hypothetical protein KGI00_00250 [Candidatus Micrarchaeota archaeon]|nr:hypothetical protein [Candidatus Micrarchaeota archaeon]MDE1849145.1 hypothetical protein [Candidatus Micrarchaeota archaeon]